MCLWKSVILSFLFTLQFFSPAYARAIMTIDYSDVFSNVGTNVDWDYYNQWLLGDRTSLYGALPGSYPDTHGVTLENVPYDYHHSAKLIFFDPPFLKLEVLGLGLTHKDEIHFSPSPTPASCLVKLKDRETLKVHGTLHIPGNYKPPYLENLSCTIV